MLQTVDYQEKAMSSLTMVKKCATRHSVANAFLICTSVPFTIFLVPTAINVERDTKYHDITIGLSFALHCFFAAKVFFAGKAQAYTASATNYTFLRNISADATSSFYHHIRILDEGNEYLTKFRTARIFSLCLIMPTTLSLTKNLWTGAKLDRYRITAALAIISAVTGLISISFHKKMLNLSAIAAKHNIKQYDHMRYNDLSDNFVA